VIVLIFLIKVIFSWKSFNQTNQGSDISCWLCLSKKPKGS